MHPEFLRELAAQRSREMRDRASRIRLARTASQARRGTRHGLSGPGGADEFVVPAIPDFVDGSFLPGPADDRTAGLRDQVHTTGRAA
ncbi:MAG: hypothetical protein M3Z75_17160 [Actinomycetota bacterium]|nr:hypothetical protein [Actinomycetota bacterium]